MKIAVSLSMILAALLCYMVVTPRGRDSPGAETARVTVERLIRETDSLLTRNNIDSAATVARLAVREGFASLGEADTSYISAVVLLARCTKKQGSIAEAESLLTTARTIAEGAFGDDHPKTAEVLEELADLVRWLGDGERGLSLLEQVLEMRIKRFGPSSLEVAATWNTLSNVLWWAGKSREADSALAQAMRICQYHPGQQMVVMAGLRVRGERHRILGRLAEAESCFVQALSILETLPEENRYQSAMLLNESARLCLAQSRHQQAELYLKRAQRLLSGPYEHRHADVSALIWNSVGGLRKAQGRDDEAEAAYVRALNLKLEIRAHNNSEIAQPLNNLGQLYIRQGRLAEAEDCLERALKARAEHPTLGPDHPWLVYSLNGLATVYTLQERYAEASQTLQRSLGIAEKAHGHTHPNVRWCLTLLGDLQQARGDYSAAESLFTEALAINEKLTGPEHPNNVESLRNLAIIHGTMGHIETSVAYFKRMYNLRRTFIHDAFAYASEEQKLQYVSAYPLIDYAFLSLAASDGTGKAYGPAYETVALGKGIVIDAVAAEKTAACCSYDATAVALVEDYAQIASTIANMALADASYFPENVYRDSLRSLFDAKEAIEVELSQRCSEFAGELSARQISVSKLAAAVGKQAVLWEFVKYHPYDFAKQGPDPEKNGPPRYLAFTLDHVGTMSVVDLGEACLIDSLVATARQMIYDAGRNTFLPVSAESYEELHRVTGKLYETVFAPLEPTLSGKSELLIAPDGNLNLLPFDIFLDPSGRYVIEDYTVSYLSSGKDLLRFGKTESLSDLAIVIADPDFYLSADSVVSYLSQQDRSDGERSLNWHSTRSGPDCLEGRFGPVPHSRREMDMVISTLRKHNRTNIDSYSGGYALEEVVKELSVAPRVLHLATHGYFCEETDGSKIPLLENPLIRSGLAFSGANRLRFERTDSGYHAQDGILTALEVSGLNLVGTELVVLSACETGIGDVRSGEGVFGLRRAFQHAGAEAVIMSMWRVPDEETCTLMQCFYEAWLGGVGKRQALRAAALQVMQEKRAESGTAHPLFWGGFVLVGNPD